MKRWYRLPNGEQITNEDAYVRAWRSLAKPIVDRLDVRLMAFDPDLRFVKSNGTTFDVSVEVAQLVKDLVELQRNHPFR